MNIEVEGGKYTFKTFDGDWRVYIYRCGDPWVAVDVGCNAVVSLMHYVRELEDIARTTGWTPLYERRKT